MIIARLAERIGISRVCGAGSRFRISTGQRVRIAA